MIKFCLYIILFFIALIVKVESAIISIIVEPQSSVSSNNRAAHFNWQFESENGAAPVIGQYACGSYWVAPASGDSGVRLLSLTGSGIQGQTDLLSLDSNPSPNSHGLLGLGSKTYGSHNSSENDEPKLPLVYSPQANSAISLVAAMQRNEAETSKAGTKGIEGAAVDAYCFITVLPSPPPDNGINSIRPNIVGDQKEFLTWSDFDLSKLPSHQFIGSHTSFFSNPQIRWNHSTEVFSMQIRKDGVYQFFSEGGRAFRAHILHHNYAAGWANSMYDTLMKLMGSDPIEIKKPVLASVLAHGLDTWYLRYGIQSYPGAWSSGAGQFGGQFNTPAFFAALLKEQGKAIHMRKTIVENYTATSDYLRGPQEMRQVMRGQTGIPLWGDEHDYLGVRSSELDQNIHRRYWADLKDAGCFEGSATSCNTSTGKKTSADPHGYIDGPPTQAGISYFVVTAGSARAFSALMILFPEFAAIANCPEVIEYADRIGRFGRWTLPDPVATPTATDQLDGDCSPWNNPGGCNDYRISWGPTLDDRRYAIEDGIGRFPSRHGQIFDIGYKTNLVENNWNEIISLYNGLTFEDTLTPIGTVVAPDIYFFNDDSGAAFAFLRCSTFDSIIHYEIGDSIMSTPLPSVESPIYSGFIPINVGQVIKAYAVKDGSENSAISTKQISWSPEIIPDETAPLLSDISVSKITSSSAVIEWTSNESATSVVEYGTTNSYGQTASTSGLTTSHNVALTGLQDDTTYYYRVRSTDSSNNEAIFGEFTFVTLIPDDIDPTCTLISPLGGEILSTSVILTASASDNPGGSGVATVEFLLNGNVIGSGSQSDSTTYTLNWDTTIVQNGNYTLQAVVTDFDGNLGASNQIFVTVDNSTSGVVLDSNWWNESIITQTGIFEVSFDVVPFTNAIDGVIGIASTSADSYSDLVAIVRFFTNGKIDARNGGLYEADVDLTYQSGVKYRVRMRVDVPNKLYSTWITPQGQAEVLLANNYAFRTEQSGVTSLAWIASVNIEGNHELSNWKVNLFSDETAPVISQVLASSVTSNSAIITWNTDESATSMIDYGTTTTYDQIASTAGSTKSHSVQITGLKSDTDYHFSVRSTDLAGNKSVSGDFTFNTLTSIDTTPPYVVITQLNDGDIVSGFVDITVDASDNNGVSQVAFEVNGIEVAVDSTSPYTFNWDTTAEADGSYIITAIATDNSGNTESFSISVIVENTPNPSILPPSLFMNSEDLVRVQGIVTDSSSPFYSNYQLLISRADSALGEVPDPFFMGDVSQIQFGWCQPANSPDDSLKDLTKKLEIQGDRGRTLALAWLLTGNQSYADGAVEMLNAWASGSTLVNMYDFNINFNNATFDGSTSDGYCGVRPWNMALDATWQAYGLINFADSYIILKSNGYPFSATEENLIRDFILELTEAVNSGLHAWTRWADAHPNSSSFERYRSDNHLSWCLAGLISGAVALEDEALADYVLNGGAWLDSKAGSYANPSSIRSVINYSIESGTGQENEGRMYEEKILRDPPIGYSLFHLWPMTLVATVAEKHYNDDIWNFKGTDNGGMRDAYERYSAHILGERPSPRPEQEGNLEDYRWLYELAYARWQTERFESVLSIGPRNKHIVQSIGSVNLLTGWENASTDPGNQDLTSGLVGYWNFDETSGNVANDSSPNDYDGIVEGANWSPGNINNALSFDAAAGDRVDLGDFNVSGNLITLAAWVNPSAVTTDSRIISKATGTVATDVFWILEIDDDPDGAHRLGFRINSGETYIRITGGTVSLGEWTHVVGVYDGTMMRLYQDGIEIANQVKTGSLREGVADVWIGNNSPNNDRGLDGLIDEVRIYNRALNIEEVVLLRDATIPLAPEGLQIILEPQNL